MAKRPPKKPGRALVPQKHGGALLPGGAAGAQPGAGRPPSIIRERLRVALADRIPILEAIADGQVIQKTRVGIVDLLPHVVCANCGEAQIRPSDPEAVAFVEVDAMVSASPRDRILALEMGAKYGLGQLKEISVENVRERVASTMAVIRQHVAPELYQAMLPQLRAQWS